MTTSGNFSPTIGQSFTPGKVTLPSFISPAGSAQGAHVAPWIAGLSPSAGMSVSREPAPWAAIAPLQRKSATANAANMNSTPFKNAGWRSAGGVAGAGGEVFARSLLLPSPACGEGRANTIVHRRTPTLDGKLHRRRGPPALGSVSV